MVVGLEPRGSWWLFIGYTTASLGFLIYSLLQQNWVFVATNAALLLSSIAGLLITLRNRKRVAFKSSDFIEFGPVPDLRLSPAPSADSPPHSERR